ncbi:nicotinate phosphoribosyltransferase [Blastopirellula marina]|uniref:Nicotinate phosphoribosyltransferase n=1 Tax=Blastopirellula marina TaxID=124 RepID=A0A2S8GAS1_9BACT|nr:nicotinate phosphoribosyltransferase [Blastopirellula marina]PQO41194.1 nicotinate phosphoribosyltransferase [Blastopirellula marina]PTL46070.1 nicotinate phosphoribosyltransferase [Blastopirellula marina]
MINELYQPPLALLTDLYQLTMAYGYWKLGRADQQAVFHLFFRKPPFAGGYAVAAGLEQALQYLERFRFDASDLEYLASLTGNDDAPLFEQGFLEYLDQTKLTVDVDAVPEGTITFGQEPLLRVRGPILQCQLLETPLLNLINFQTLIATKASRIATAAGDDPILEFGLRRAQGIDGALSASRAAYIGGSAATSNVLAGKMLGIPVKGTHAHSWVMSFATEAEAFDQYAAAMPNNCVFLVDTYDTLDGVRQACEVGKTLRQRGHEMVGIRLDSGDLAYLSIEARKILDEAGFPAAAIVASNDLDEHIIESLKTQGSQIAIWGVGTKLVTAFDQPALGGVYKLAAIQQADGTWLPKVKLSEQAIKTSIPGTLQVRRYLAEGRMIGDMIYDQTQGIDPRGVIVDSKDATRRKRLVCTESTDLLQPTMRAGERVSPSETLTDIRQRAKQQLASLHPTIKRFMNPHEYPVGLDIGLHELRDKMIHEARQSRWNDEETTT